MKRQRIFIALAVFMVLAACMPGSVRAQEYDGLVRVRTVLVTSVTGNGSPVMYPATDNAEITAAEVVIGAGAETGWHTHAIPVYAWVLSGTLSVEYADGTSRVFKTGDAIIEVVGTAHNGRTVGTDPVRLVVFYTGIKGMPNTVKVAPPVR